MRWRETVRSAARGLRRRPLRNGLAATGVALATATLVILLALSSAARRGVLANLEDQPMVDTIQVTPATGHAGVAPRPIDDAAIAEISGLPGVRSVTPLLVVPAGLRIGDGGPSGTVLGWEPRGRVPFALAAGRAPAVDEADAIIVTPAGLRASGYGAEAIVGRTAQLELRRAAPSTETRRLDVRVVGVSETEIPGIALVPLPLAQDALAWIATGETAAARDARLAQQAAAALLFGGHLLGADLASSRYSSLWVSVGSVDDVLPVRSAIEDHGWAAFAQEAVVRTVDDLFRAVNALLVAVASAGLLLAALGIVNALVTSVSERTAEIGVLKALGATDGSVARLVVVEAAMLGFIGGIAGVLLGWIGAEAAAFAGRVAAGGVRVDLEPRPDVPVAAAALGVAVLLAAVAAWIPARSAAALVPADALRSE